VNLISEKGLAERPLWKVQESTALRVWKGLWSPEKGQQTWGVSCVHVGLEQTGSTLFRDAWSNSSPGQMHMSFWAQAWTHLWLVSKLLRHKL